MVDQIKCGSTEVSALCAIHGEHVNTITRIGSLEVESGCPDCSKTKEDSMAREKRASELREKQTRREIWVKSALGRSGIPKRFENRTFDNYKAENEGQKAALSLCKRYAEKFEGRMAHGGGLVMCGKPGTGKNHLSTAIAKQVIESGRSAVFATAIGITRHVKATYSRDSEKTEQQAINFWIAHDLLIIDEVGIQFGSEAEKIILFEVLNGRYQEMRPTIVMSNLPDKDLGEFLGERIVDRLQEGGGAIIAFDWDSYRAKVHKDENLPVEAPSEPQWDTSKSNRGF